MTWKTHKLTTATVVLAVTGNPLWAFLAAMGSVIPDGLEFILYGHDVPIWKHRKFTHWPIPYLITAVVLAPVILHLPVFHALSALSISDIRASVEILKSLNYPPMHVIPVMAFWFSIGAVLHILEDALTGKVPLLDPKRKNFGVRLFRTKSLTESLVFLGVLFVFAFVIKWKLGGER